MKFSKFSLLIIFCLLISPQSSLAQNTNTILILPFDVQADAKYDFLKPAIVKMLFTRLSAPGRALVIGEQPGSSQAEAISLADALQIGQQKGADYIVTGSIILQDDAISTDADFIGIVEKRALVAFTQQGPQPGDIITQIDNFTAQVNADVFNPSAFAGEETSQTEVPNDIYQHPEKLIIPEIPSETSPKKKPNQPKEAPPAAQPVDNR